MCLMNYSKIEIKSVRNRQGKFVLLKWDIDTSICVRGRRELNYVRRLSRKYNFKFGFPLDVQHVLNNENVEKGLEKSCKYLGKFYNSIYFNGI